MAKLSAILTELETTFSQFEKQNKAVSEGSVGWHIEHSLKVIIAVFETLEKANPEEYKWAFNFRRTFILSKGKIPRGRAKAPKHVIPVGEISHEKLAEMLTHARTLLLQVDQLHPNAFFKHPLFGLLNKKSTHRFLAIHTRHHIDIIMDILR